MKNLLIITTIIILFYSCQSSNSEESNRNNGDLNSTFLDSTTAYVSEIINPVTEPIATEPILTPEHKFEQQKANLMREGWEEKSIRNGQLSSCYNFDPKSGTIYNSLKVYVGSGTDVVIKVMDLATDECVRYVFINSGTSYSINNIPEGKYYLKIAYGKNWLSKVQNGQCLGKFLSQPMYEKGEDIIDFNVKTTYEGYSIPSFSLELDVISSSSSNSFNSANISESEFNQ